VLPALSALIAIQQLDTAAEAARKRLSELPAAEQVILRKVSDHAAHVEAAKASLQANQQQRRELEKQVAAVDSRLSKFSDHKAAVKTNQEYTALLHEIETANKEKSTIEDQILGLMEGAEALSAELKEANEVLAAVRKESDERRAVLADERQALEAEVLRLKAQKAAETPGIDAPLLAKYERLLEQRKMVAVAAMVGEMCTACHVRLRPAVTQQIRRNSDIIYCDSCQRILYAPVVPAANASTPPA
jgi:predicted  nucleic acid-binding Zn-ribbon protein